MAIDSSGEIYVTGYRENFGGIESIMTFRCTPDGEVEWFDRRPGPGGGYAIALDGLGHVCVAGRGIGESGTEDFITIKYGLQGGLVWLREYDGPGAGDDYPVDLEVDALGDA